MKHNIVFPLIIFIVNLFFYVLFNYGGIRSPDCEIVFRTTESLLNRKGFAVQEPIDWQYFGLAKGIDNEYYSIFGPAQSVLAVPLLKFAHYIKNNASQTMDSNYIPISLHVQSNNRDAGLYVLEDRRPPKLDGQFERFIVSFFNVMVSALSALFFYFVLLRVTESRIVSFYTTFLYSLGSLIFAYTGTFFSEPLCTLFIIISFLFIIKNERVQQKSKHENQNYFYSGLFLGLAIITHISAVLSVPFYFMFILGQKNKNKLILKEFAISSFCFTLGLAIFCVALLYYNHARFGNAFETGRSADPLIHYAIYSNPIPAMYGLMFSSGKGLLIYSPIVLLGFLFWKQFHKKFAHLSIAIIGMILIRFVFIASRSDWHGGFCLGPRYFIIIIPYLFIPIAKGIKSIIANKELKQFLLVSLFGFLCIVQQVFFSLGEIFTYLHIVYRQQKVLGVETLSNNALYFDWKYSPALYLLDYKTGSFFLKFLSNNNYLLWALMVIMFVLCFSLLVVFTYISSFKSDAEPLYSSR